MHIIRGTVPGVSRLARAPELSKGARQRLKWMGYYLKRGRTTIIMQHWVVGVRGVGGDIDVAVITQTEGFSDIQKKKITGEEI